MNYKVDYYINAQVLGDLPKLRTIIVQLNFA